MKEPDFQPVTGSLQHTDGNSRIQQKIWSFPERIFENIKQIAGNSLQDETKIRGFYPIIGKQGRDSIKLLNDGETVPTVIQKFSSSEKKNCRNF